MAERTASPRGFVTRNSFLCLFSITSILFVTSWLSVLRSTGRPHSIDRTLLPNSKLFSVADNTNSKIQNRHDIEPPNESTEKVQEEKISKKCESNYPVLKVFMYDMPAEFHFGLLDWTPEKGGSVWPDIRTKIPSYPGGLNLQHSVEYWLTLDLLSSEFPENQNSRFAVRVRNSSEADVVFVPFFSSLSYNHFTKTKQRRRMDGNRLLQDKMVKYLTAQDEWIRSGGRDHVIMAHHPNSMLDARMKVWPAMFILSDFGRYPPSIANLHKDVIAPYKHVIRNFIDDNSTFDSRPTLLYFQGAIYRKDVRSLPFLFSLFLLIFLAILLVFPSDYNV